VAGVVRGRLKDLGFGLTGELNVTLSLAPSHADELKKLMGEEIDVEVKKWREKRSRDSNAMMWAICQELSDALKITKEEVYRKAIRDIGDYIPLPIREDAVEAFIKNWQGKGIGWVAEVIDDSKIPGYKLVFAYYGSSTFDTKTMSKLLDYLIDDAEQCGIVLKASKELEQRAREINVSNN
jgi:hypothetical protein